MEDIADYLQKTGGRTRWDYLRSSDSESRDIYQLLSANRISSSLHSGARGSKESLMDLNGKNIAVLHLATHGFFNQDVKGKDREQDLLRRQPRGGNGQGDAENPLTRSGLVFSGVNTLMENPVEGAENGVLLAEEAAGLDLLGAQLVVLSACDTALREADNSEGIFSLQRAFKLAGVQTLIMSLWRVDAEAGSIFFNEFYRSWFSGKSKQEAFKEAQQKVRANSRYSLPFYWAAFVMMD
jgi:CHAT domain-containing protein